MVWCMSWPGGWRGCCPATSTFVLGYRSRQKRVGLFSGHGGNACPQPQVLSVFLDDSEVEGGTFTIKALEAAPALVGIQIESPNTAPTLLGAAALQSLTAALQRGALQNWQDLALISCTMGDGNFKEFMDPLEDSGCVPIRFWTLGFTNCWIGVEGVRSFTGLLRQGTFPVLKALGFANNPDVKDVGVVALVEALQQCTETFLDDLDLNEVGMGDEGLKALASLIHRGRFKQLKHLHVSYYGAITDRGMIALARAIDACGLPKLEKLWVEGLNEVTVSGCSAIAHAVMKGCPKLKEIYSNE